MNKMKMHRMGVWVSTDCAGSLHEESDSCMKANRFPMIISIRVDA